MTNPNTAAEPDPPAAPAPPAAAAKRSPMLSLAAAMLVVTVLGVAVGGAFGLLLLPKAEKETPAKADPASPPAVKGRFGPTASLRALAPIVTNLASPQNTWVRVEAALVVDGEQTGDANVLAAQITEDLIAFLRTVSLVQIEGASGFQHLREDLSDRVRVRSGGKVRDLVLQTFIVE
jgi:flagellar protein FliL